MGITEYYQKAKEIGLLSELKNTEESKNILLALDDHGEDGLDDHPSYWLPKVQAALLQCFITFPESEFATRVIELYVQGKIMEDGGKRNLSLKVGFVCLIIGFLIGLVAF
jgi:hypothetical protein